MSIKHTLISKLTDSDKERPRSQQVRVGPSEIGGCSRRVWYKLHDVAQTNPDTLRLAAIMGTALHSMIEDVFAGDPQYLIETEVEVGEIMGHIDLIDTETNTIWDWKTTTKNSLSYFGSEQQKSQVHLYGYLANQNGIQVDYVGLVAIARDGNENDIVEIVEPYNEAIALDAIAKYNRIKKQEEPPRPEKDASFCENYCPYFGECPGIVNASSEEPIENEEMVLLIKNYKDLQGQSKAVSAQIDFIKARLEGTTGITPDGTQVKWVSVAGRETIDEAAVQAELGYVPKKKGNGYNRLTVK
ncbi:CRISPR-associated Cas4-like protein [uncultured Caudovirales phage]|uniref:CRISPR-associated Cas4-like protein n=1 Tax=uncultured Caudovirales phage TaxID=2100421 RepID=A0A6J5RLK5_9CAUD|nr:CRISPR-associated Cas4-like protein [uncultured Caudovirales phage]